MDTSPIDPVFGPSSYPREEQDHPTGNGTRTSPPVRNDAAVESASSEIGAIAGAIEELQSRLERANEQLGQVAAVQTTEFEIGRLFMEAQRFSEATLSRLEMQIQEILVEAEAKAAEILREANEDAEKIRREAQQSSFIPARTAQELQSAIAGFASVNNELIRELNALNAMLAPSNNRMAPPMDRSVDRMRSL
jgi:cell division septum initiation protein DivIVA